MISVSDAWKEAHAEKLLPETFVEISMDIGNTDVSGTMSGENEASFSYPSQILDNTRVFGSKRYAFLEHNSWSLNGSRSLLSDINTYRPAGFVGNDDGACKLIIQLSESYVLRSILGFTITWSTMFDSYATSFSLLVENQGNVIRNFTVTNNRSPVSVIDLPVSTYDSLTITVLEWSHPEQRPRIDAVLFGKKIIFGKNELISYTHDQSGSPLGTEITQNTIEFTVDNSDGRWNLLNPDSMAQYLFERQTLYVRYGLQTRVGVEWIQGGTFYLSEWGAPSNGVTATFVARDAAEFLLNAKYSRPYWEAVTTGDTLVYSSKDEVIGGDWINSISSGLYVRVYEKSIRYPDGEGLDPDGAGWMTYRIDEGWVNADTVRITSVKTLLYDVTTAYGSCCTVPLGSEVFTSFSTYESPVAIEEMSVAEFIQQSAASCGITMWQDSKGVYHLGTVDTTLTDYVIPLETSYSYPEVELTKPLKQVDVVYHYQHHDATKTNGYKLADTGEVITVDAPFVWKNNSRTVSLAEKYIAWWKLREIVSGEFRGDPRLDLFDVVTVETKYGDISPVMITNLKYTYNGSFRATYSGKRILTEYDWPGSDGGNVGEQLPEEEDPIIPEEPPIEEETP